VIGDRVTVLPVSRRRIRRPGSTAIWVGRREQRHAFHGAGPGAVAALPVRRL